MRYSTGGRTRVLFSVAAVGALSLTLAACGGSSEGASSSTKSINVVVHSNKPSDAGWKALGAAFEKANPGSKVNFSFIPTEQFAKVRNSRLAAGDIDVTEGSSSGGTRETPDYAKGVVDSDWVRGLKAGQWVELKGSYLDGWSPAVRKAMQYQGKDYGVPTAVSYVNGVYYNKALFAKYNLQAPRTWSDFVKALDTFKSNGVTPLVMGGAEKWPVGLLMEGVVNSSVSDMDGLDKALWTGQAKFTDPQQVEVLSKLQQLYSYAPKTFPGTTDAAANSAFTTGKAAMFPEGTWQQPGIEQGNPSFELGYVPLPGSEDPTTNVLRGKLEASLAIPTNSKQKDLAQKFLEFYSQPANYQAWVTAAGAVPVQPNIKSTPFIDSLQEYLAPGGFAPTWGSVFHPNPTAPKAVRVGFPYDQIAPMGTETDMAKLAASSQQAWESALPKG